jgi:SAM-dependent methyltransferase
VFLIREQAAGLDHLTQFHKHLDEPSYVDYFEPLRKGQYRQVLERVGVPPGGSLLDVGASYGWMVEVGLELGLDSYGIEPSPLDYKPGLEGRIYTATLEEFANRAERQFSVVTAWHVMEHLDDPIGAGSSIHELVEPGGHAVVAVPNASGWMFRAASLLARRLHYRRLMEELFYTWNPNMHRSYPTPKAMRLILSRAGFDVVETYCMEAFDWRRIWRRSTNPVGRPLLRAVGPLIARSRFTGRENLIVVARKSAAGG